MARARNIKPSFFANEVLAQCEYGARLCFIGLWCLADRDGRLEDRPLRIKGQLFPYESVDVDGWLTVLAENGFITRYSAAGAKYIQINAFSKHQNPHCKEPASTIPAPCAHSANTILAGLIPDPLNPITDSPSRIPDSVPNESARDDSLRMDSDQFEDGEIPGNLDTPEFRHAWAEWLSYKGRRYKASGRTMQLNRLSDLGPSRAAAAIRYSIAQAYQGIFEESRNGNGRTQQPIIRGVREGDEIAKTL